MKIVTSFPVLDTHKIEFASRCQLFTLFSLKLCSHAYLQVSIYRIYFVDRLSVWVFNRFVRNLTNDLTKVWFIARYRTSLQDSPSSTSEFFSASRFTHLCVFPFRIICSGLHIRLLVISACAKGKLDVLDCKRLDDAIVISLRLHCRLSGSGGSQSVYSR